MTRTDAAGLFCIALVIGWGVGLMTNGEIYYYAGKNAAKQEAKEYAKRWAEEELKAHCFNWYTDRRKHDYMACKKPEWMK